MDQQRTVQSQHKKANTNLLTNGLIWFGAGVSLAEIHTGTAYANMEWKTAITAILLGHLIGGILLFLAGLMGARTGKSSMETVRSSFGRKGAVVFSILNVIQLVGWTAIMIFDGSLAANEILASGQWLWSVIIGALIILWLFIGIRSLSHVNTVAMGGLFLLTILLSQVIFFGNASGTSTVEQALSFGAALELAIAMPLSWLPLISDYTRDAKEPVKATAVSAITYSLISSWMYFIGMGAASITGTSDIAQIMVQGGIGIAGLIIILLSTVTTTFLDAYSAGVSSASIQTTVSERKVGIAVTLIGIAGAIALPLQNITGFLFFIGSVFAPMIALLISDHYILRKDLSHLAFDRKNIAVWLIGFIAYRYFMKLDLAMGSTIPAMALTIVGSLAVAVLSQRFSGEKSVAQP